jgi:hypothetical protein
MLNRSESVFAISSSGPEKFFFGEELQPDAKISFAATVYPKDNGDQAISLLLFLPFFATLGLIPAGPTMATHTTEFAISVNGSRVSLPTYRDAEWWGIIPAIVAPSDAQATLLRIQQGRQIGGAILASLPNTKPVRTERLRSYWSIVAQARSVLGDPAYWEAADAPIGFSDAAYCVLPHGVYLRTVSQSENWGDDRLELEILNTMRSCVDLTDTAAVVVAAVDRLKSYLAQHSR